MEERTSPETNEKGTKEKKKKFTGILSPLARVDLDGFPFPFSCIIPRVTDTPKTTEKKSNLFFINLAKPSQQHFSSFCPISLLSFHYFKISELCMLSCERSEKIPLVIRVYVCERLYLTCFDTTHQKHQASAVFKLLYDDPLLRLIVHFKTHSTGIDEFWSVLHPATPSLVDITRASCSQLYCIAKRLRRMGTRLQMATLCVV